MINVVRQINILVALGKNESQALEHRLTQLRWHHRESLKPLVKAESMSLFEFPDVFNTQEDLDDYLDNLQQLKSGFFQLFLQGSRTLAVILVSPQDAGNLDQVNEIISRCRSTRDLTEGFPRGHALAKLNDVIDSQTQSVVQGLRELEESDNNQPELISYVVILKFDPENE